MKWLGYSLLTLLVLLIGLNSIIWGTAYFLPAPPKQADVMVILGAKVEGDPPKPHPILQDRLDQAVEYLTTNNKTQVIVCGSHMPNTPASEASVMRDYLIKHGIAASRIHVEDRSTRTAQQLLYANQTYPLQGKVILLSSDFHMLRALLLAKRSGFAVSGLGAKTHFNNIGAWWMLFREPWALINSTLRDFPLKMYSDTAKPAHSPA